MDIEPFGVELWMNEFENHCELNLAETCVDSLTVEQLLQLCGLSSQELLDQMLPLRLDYGAIEGSRRLRRAIAALYAGLDGQGLDPDRVLVTHGAIGANSLIHQTMVSAGDRVVSLLPNYQQHYSIPESIGAEVVRLQLRPERAYLVDLDQLAEAATPGTRLIAMSNPNNPTGSLMDRAFLEQVVAIADRCEAYVLCDEVYRGTDQVGGGATASVADLHPRGISTGSMSKAFSLAGLRLGWLAGPSEVVEQVMIHRDYNTISVGMLDDLLAALALENAEPILARSRDITRRNLALLERWVEGEPLLDWVKPRSGTTALIHYDLELSARDFCVGLLEETGVMFVPGSSMGIERSIRIGYANDTAVLTAGLDRVSDFLRKRKAPADT